MQTYRITFFAPFTFAEFSCEAATLAEARELRAQRDKEQCFMIPNRDIKAEYWNGKKV